jgi:alkylhydroperoxidase family enzyme
MDYPNEAALNPVLKKIVAEKAGANVYRMLTHAAKLAPAVTELSDAIMWNDSWPALWRELAIIRVGHHYASPYEIYHHERVGKMAGATDAQLAACTVGADQSALSQDERLILELTDRIIENHGLSAADRSKALGLLSPEQLANLVLTVGYYQMTCNFLNSFDIQIETTGPLSPDGGHVYRT